MQREPSLPHPRGQGLLGDGYKATSFSQQSRWECLPQKGTLFYSLALLNKTRRPFDNAHQSSPVREGTEASK
jgi:hypothetical protein